VFLTYYFDKLHQLLLSVLDSRRRRAFAEGSIRIEHNRLEDRQRDVGHHEIYKNLIGDATEVELVDTLQTLR
jgi:hypothetical protein